MRLTFDDRTTASPGLDGGWPFGGVFVRILSQSSPVEITVSTAARAAPGAGTVGIRRLWRTESGDFPPREVGIHVGRMGCRYSEAGTDRLS